MTARTGYRMFDADQHFYEPRDSFTRYIDPAYRDKTLRPVVGPDGVEIMMAGDRRTAHDVKIFDEVGRPGSLREFLLHMKDGGSADDPRLWEPIRREYQDRDARIALMDSQRVEACLMFNNTAIFAQQWLPDLDVLYASLWAFNRWQEEEWGYAYQHRIFTPAVLSMHDVDRAVELLEWAIDRGARAIILTAGPAGGRSPAHPDFDPFWARVDEAGLVVAFHITDAGYTERRSPEWGLDPRPTFYTQSAFQWMFFYGEGPVQETIAAMIFDNLFGRFPNVRIVTAEYGVEWAPQFCRRLDKMRGMGRNGPWIGGPLRERPSEIFKRHVRMSPFWEDDIVTVVEQLGPEVIVGGSDFPHPEGIAEPTQLVEHLDGLDAHTQRQIMRDNGMALLRLG